MGGKINLKVETRDVRGKKVSKLRREGLTPGIVYGAKVEPTMIQLDSGDLNKVINQAGTYTPVHLTGAKKQIAMIKDVERDPVKSKVLHVSFHAVNANDPVEAKVPIRLVGEGTSEAEKNGLIILQALEEIEVRALPMELPDGLEADISGLKEAGEQITVGDLKLPEAVELVEKAVEETEEDDEEEKPSITDLVIATVYEPSALQAANEAAAGDAEDASADEVDAENGESAEDENAAAEAKAEDEA